MSEKKDVMVGLFEIVISLLVFAIVFPIVMSQILLANTTNWNNTVVTVFNVLIPILASLIIVLSMVKKHF